MADDELIAQLKRWGNATVARLAANDDGPSAGDNILAKQRDFGLKSARKHDDERQIVGRAGDQRRSYMGAKSSTPKLRLQKLPMWAVDPVPARNDADRPHDRPQMAVVDLVPDDLQWINRALARLSVDAPLREKILRTEFCKRGTHREKAKIVQREYGGKLSVDQYRRELRRALDWMRWSRAA